MAYISFPSLIVRNRLLLPLIGLVALSGCAGMDNTPITPLSNDYRINHPLKVGRERVSISLGMPSSALRLSPGDSRRFIGFLRDYIARGHGAVVVETADPDTARVILLAGGLRDGEMTFIATKQKTSRMILSFSANRVVVPTCADWSSSTGFNPSNKIHSNYGCSFQHNIGLMVDDPGDLIGAQPSAARPAALSDTAIENYINRVNAPDPGTGKPGQAATPAPAAPTTAATPAAPSAK